MDNFKIIYKILSVFEKMMDIESPDFSCIDAEHLKISEMRWTRIIQALVEAGYIAGVKIVVTKVSGPEAYFIEPHITLKGLEYLNENTTMKKFYRMAKGIKDVIPGA